ncbi:25341_t:CDS:2 [Gigaspora margarita]|uniref:25341_t:CDS:1 n=1 Tax=Gigaspora margarita TaxID=4874 RepID=A0ABN7VLW0_GIGMA|nr:25341_t:CDS:2 [Gigaspora margarita]
MAIPNSQEGMTYTKLHLVKAYIIDWLLCAIFLLVFFLVDTLEPFQQRFSLEDRTIQNPYAEHERVPFWLAIIIDLVVPILIITASSLIIYRSLHDLHHGLLGLMLSLTLTLAVTDFFKTFAGRPRPDFINRCNPLPGSVDAKPWGLSNSSICQQTDKDIMKDGFKSFVSGHSSFSFSGLGYLTFYFAGKLHLFDRRGHAFKSFVVLIPLAVAAYIATSRTEDYRHHWQDVVTGGLIGIPLSVRLKPHSPAHRAEFAFHDGSTFEVHVVRNDDGTSVLKNTGALQPTKRHDDPQGGSDQNV